ncbi:MAG: phospholipase A [Campylobacterota bacterium]
MRTILLSLILTPSLLFASNIHLQNKAKAYEKKGDYKKAMKIYKQLFYSKYKNENKSLKSKQENSIINKVRNKETKESLTKILTKNFNILPYKKNYFLPITYDTIEKSNRKNVETKFQFSIQKPIITNLFGLDETISFAYTQKSFWQTTKHSAPFRETNYMPEIFMKAPIEDKYLKAYKLSFVHESNGQDKQYSRSWNRVYLESFFQFDELFIIPKIWFRIPEDKKDDDNPDIEDYYGYGDLKLAYPYKNHLLELSLKNNLKFNKNNKSSVKLDYTFPLGISGSDTFGYLQLFHGYGDSLIDYNQRTNRIGFGISLSR